MSESRKESRCAAMMGSSDSSCSCDASTVCRSFSDRAPYALATAFIASSSAPWCLIPPLVAARAATSSAWPLITLHMSMYLSARFALRSSSRLLSCSNASKKYEYAVL